MKNSISSKKIINQNDSQNIKLYEYKKSYLNKMENKINKIEKEISELEPNKNGGK